MSNTVSGVVPHAYYPGHDGENSIDGIELKRFADSRLNDTINALTSTLTPGKSGAVIAYADQDVGRFAVIARKGEHWSAVGLLSHTWDTGQNSASGAVRFEW